MAKAIKRLNQTENVHEVLIIDDDPNYLHLLQKMVEDEGKYLPILANGGKAALKLLDDFTPDVILMDLLLEDVNGFELLERFNTDARLMHVPVIIITGSDLDNEQRSVLENYSEQILSKWKVNKEDLLRNLQEMLTRMRGFQAVV